MISVTKEDTFECIIRLKESGYINLIALDFASGSNPGGSWKSKQQGTQEERLCRRSDLGLLLKKQKYPIELNGYRYIKKVTITHNEKNEKLKEPITCSIIASELRGISSSKTTYLKERIISLYEIAVKNNHDIFVLGAWGCGAFAESDEDAEILAKEMYKCAKEYEGKIHSVFAVYGSKNYKIFSKAFSVL